LEFSLQAAGEGSVDGSGYWISGLFRSFNEG